MPPDYDDRTGSGYSDHRHYREDQRAGSPCSICGRGDGLYQETGEFSGTRGPRLLGPHLTSRTDHAQGERAGVAPTHTGTRTRAPRSSRLARVYSALCALLTSTVSYRVLVTTRGLC